MPTVSSEVTYGEKKLRAVLSWQTQGVAYNCGAMIASSFNLRITNEAASAWGYGTSALTTDLLLCTLDSLWPQIHKQFEISCKGMCILTDNVRRALKNLWDANPTDEVNLTTAVFVQWLIMRKHGAIGRGLTTVNQVHRGDSVLTSWVWCPDKTYALSMDQPFYEDAEPKLPNQGSLTVIANEYNEGEPSLRKQENVAKASVVRRKRAG